MIRRRSNVLDFKSKFNQKIPNCSEHINKMQQNRTFCELMDIKILILRILFLRMQFAELLNFFAEFLVTIEVLLGI